MIMKPTHKQSQSRIQKIQKQAQKNRFDQKPYINKSQQDKPQQNSVTSNPQPNQIVQQLNQSEIIIQNQVDQSEIQGKKRPSFTLRKFKTQREYEQKRAQDQRQNANGKISPDLGGNKVKGSNSMNEVESEDLIESELEDNESLTNDTMAKNFTQLRNRNGNKFSRKIAQEFNYYSNDVSGSHNETSNPLKLSISSVDDFKLASGLGRSANFEKLSSSRDQYTNKKEQSPTISIMQGSRQLPRISKFTQQRESIKESNEEQFFQTSLNFNQTQADESFNDTSTFLRTSYGGSKYPKFVKFLKQSTKRVISKRLSVENQTKYQTSYNSFNKVSAFNATSQKTERKKQNQLFNTNIESLISQLKPQFSNSLKQLIELSIIYKEQNRDGESVQKSKP
eukprot:403368371